MKLTIDRSALLPIMQIVTGVVEKRLTIPVLGNVLLGVNDGVLTVTGTNNEVELQASMQGIGLPPHLRTTLPARKLFDIVKALPDDASLNFELRDNRMQLRSGSFHSTLATLPADHFPVFETDQEALAVQVPQGKLKQLIESVAFSMAVQDVRYYLNGMLMVFSRDGIKAVATDGHRLALCGAEYPVDCEETSSVIIPRKGVMELARMLEHDEQLCAISMGKRYFRVSTPGFRFSCKLIEGKFPDYQRVIPQGGDKVLVADRQALKSVIFRASILSEEASNRNVRLHLEHGSVAVSSHNPEQEQAEDSLEVNYEGESLQIGCNATYLLDVLNTIPQTEVAMTFSNSNSSVLIQAKDHPDAVYVVMPMRL